MAGDSLARQYHKLSGLLMKRFNVTEVEFTSEEIAALEGHVIIHDTRGEKLILRLMTEAEAEKFIKENDPHYLEGAGTKFNVEYEIPPMRAILNAVCRAESEFQLRQQIQREQPKWKIRRIKELE